MMLVWSSSRRLCCCLTMEYVKVLFFPPSPLGVMDRLQQLIKGCQLWNLCRSSFTRWAKGGELVRHTRVFPHVCFPAAVLISYHGVFFFRDRKWGKGGRSLPGQVIKAPRLCVFHFGIECFVQHSSKAGFRTIHTEIIYEPIISAANPSLIANCSKSGNWVQLMITTGIYIINPVLSRGVYIGLLLGYAGEMLSLRDSSMKENAAFMQNEQGTESKSVVQRKGTMCILQTKACEMAIT